MGCLGHPYVAEVLASGAMTKTILDPAPGTEI